MSGYSSPVRDHLVKNPLDNRNLPRRAVFLGQVLVGFGMIDDPFGGRVPFQLFARPERDVSQVADRGKPVAVSEVARARFSRLDGVEPLPMVAHRAREARLGQVDLLASLREDAIVVV